MYLKFHDIFACIGMGWDETQHQSSINKVTVLFIEQRTNSRPSFIWQ